MMMLFGSMSIRRMEILCIVLLIAYPMTCNAFWSVKSEEQDTKKEKRELNSPTTNKKAYVPVPALDFGVDISFPMHHLNTSKNYAWLPHNMDPSIPVPPEYKDMPIQPLGDKQADYEDFIQGCVQKWGKKGGKRCISTENDRIEMSLRQPQSMQNYTEMGFKKIRAPEPLFKLISDFWEKNKNKGKTEQWGVGNTYTNNWKAPTEMVSVEDNSLRGGGYSLKQKIWDAAKFTIMEWTGEDLTQCSLYGIRVYKDGAQLATHVDRLPLVSSAIINVAQDVDEPWPIEVIGHDGRAHNVTMEPGDMVLYESHSVLHGRPYPLKGRFYANLFVHFEPTGHSLRHHGLDLHSGKHVDEKYKDSLARGRGGHEHETGLPPYVIPGTPEAAHWKQMHPKGYDEKPGSFTTGSTVAHIAAKNGQVEALKSQILKDKDIVNAKDENGWTPLHEAIRAGHHDAVKFLVENGADYNKRTGHGQGGTALWWAKQEHGANHPIVTFLEGMGALYAGPEL